MRARSGSRENRPMAPPGATPNRWWTRLWRFQCDRVHPAQGASSRPIRRRIVDGIPSHSTRVRLAPVEPMPRRETPCVVGFAESDDDRRKRVNPGTSRRRSSGLTPGMSVSPARGREVTDAGDSASTRPATVTDVLREPDGGVCRQGAVPWTKDKSSRPLIADGRSVARSKQKLN